MAYLTQEQFEEAFSQRELAGLLQGGADFQAQADAASSTIDGYLASRYSLPLTTTPAMVRGWALDIARYRLWSDAAPDEVRRRYDDALQQLRDLAAGRVSLPPGSDGTPATTSGLEFASDGPERVFTMDTLAGF